MATTLRYGTGFKGSNVKYVIRKKTTVHVYEENGKKMVRITKSVSKTTVKPKSRFISNTSSTATMNMKGLDGVTRRYVAIS